MVYDPAKARISSLRTFKSFVGTKLFGTSKLLSDWLHVARAVLNHDDFIEWRSKTHKWRTKRKALIYDFALYISYRSPIHFKHSMDTEYGTITVDVVNEMLDNDHNLFNLDDRVFMCLRAALTIRIARELSRRE